MKIAIFLFCLASAPVCNQPTAVRSGECLPDIAWNTCPTAEDAPHFWLPPDKYVVKLGAITTLLVMP